MTFEMATFLGMGAILLFGIIALLLVFFFNKKESDYAHGHHV
jgi:hypothetical protein